MSRYGITLAAPPSQYTNLVFSDEFTGASLDTAKWQTVYPWGYRGQPNDGQEHMDDAFTVANSICTIAIKQEDVVDVNYGTLHYKSGMLSSYGSFSFQYGRVDIRAKCPTGRGFWATLWLLPISQASRPELDILELLGFQPTHAHLNAHLVGPSDIGTDMVVADLTTEYHVYSLIWTASRLTWLIDNIPRFSCANTAAEAMYVIVEMKIGTAANWATAPDGSATFPNSLLIDYVRVYQ